MSADTIRGEQLVRSFALIQQEHARFVEQLRIGMRTSARNQFSGTVRAIRRGAVNDEIELEVIGGLPIVATMTSDSRRELGLEVGKKAFALVAAASIIIMTERENARLSARNQLTGTVSRFTPGAINSEVVLELPGGGALAAIITNESAKTLNLAMGAVATGVFKASSVIIGVAA